MATVLAIGGVVLVVAAAILRFTDRRRFGGWLLVVLPAILSLAGVVGLAQGKPKLGQNAYENNLKGVGCGLVLLLLSVTAGLRWRWHGLFWTAWLLNAIVSGFLTYLVFFWKIFS